MSAIKELMDLRGRKALVTGATGGLGRVIAEVLAELGAELFLFDRPGSDFDILATGLNERWGTKISSIACDLESEDDRNRAVCSLREHCDELSVFINNAAFVGTSQLDGWAVPFEAQSLVTWRRAFEVNLTAVFHLTQSFLPLLKNGKGASVINIASIYGEFAPDWGLYEGTQMGNPAAYGASKGGLIQLTRWLATTLAPQIRVNAISPGGIFRNQTIDFVEKYSLRTPLKRMATEDDFRGAIAYLASDLSMYVTGQVLRVDGGWGV